MPGKPSFQGRGLEKITSRTMSENDIKKRKRALASSIRGLNRVRRSGEISEKFFLKRKKELMKALAGLPD